MRALRGNASTARDACMVVGFGALLSIVTLQSLLGSKMPSVGWGYTPLIVQRCLEAATFLLIALLASRVRGLASKRALMAVCAAAISLQGVLEAGCILGVTDGLKVPAHLCYSLVGSVCPSILWMAWIELFARLDLRRMVILFLGANVVQAVISLLVSLNSVTEIILGAIIVLPTVSLAGLLKADGLIGQAAESGEAAQDSLTKSPSGASNKHPFPLAPVALMASFTLANVFARDMLPASDRSWATIGVLACLVVLFFAIRRFNMGFDLWPLVAVAFPLTLMGLFGLLLDGGVWGIAATLLTHAGDTLFSVFIAAALCNVAFRYGTSALFLFGLAKAAGSMALLTGAMLAFRGSPWGHDSFVLLVAAMALAVCVCFIALSWKRDGEITWGVIQQSEATRLSGGDAPSEAQQLSLACSLVAYEYGLTRREEEVLALLARGSTAQQIEQALCVSNSTVKSHTHAVYQKMGLHSRAELIELMAARRGQ